MKLECPECRGRVEIDGAYDFQTVAQCPHCSRGVVFAGMGECAVAAAGEPPVMARESRSIVELAAGQDIGEVTAALAELKEYCTPGEEVVAVALQSRLMAGLSKPDVVAVTDRRLIVLARSMFGCRMMDALWIDVADVQIKESITGASIHASLVNGRAFVIEKLNKVAARSLYRVCQGREEEMRVRRHAHQLHHAAAGAAKINVNLNAPPPIR